MKSILKNFIIVICLLGCADSEVIFRISTGVETRVLKYDENTSDTWLGLFENVPNQPKRTLWREYFPAYLVTYPSREPTFEGESPSSEVKVKVWEPLMKKYPGWNPPVVEIFLADKRVAVQELSKIGWALDLRWTRKSGH